MSFNKNFVKAAKGKNQRPKEKSENNGVYNTYHETLSLEWVDRRY